MARAPFRGPLPGSMPRHLRERARGENPPSVLTKQTAEHLARELSHYQVELETRNEELRASQRELEASLEKYKERTEELRRQAELIDIAHDAIIVRDFDQRILGWNRGAEQMYGYSREEVSGEHSPTLLKTEFPVPLEEIVATFKQGGYWEGELVRERKDGRKIVVLSRWALQKDAAGNDRAILDMSLDITDRKRIEEQLRQAHKMEAIGTLAGGIAHDFNNVLAAIIGFTEMVIDDVADNKPVREKMEHVLKAGLRGRDLIKQILAFSRKTEGERREISLTPLLKETHSLLSSSLPSTIHMNLAFTTKEDCVVADPAQLEQVLLNLATNAAYAMREEGGRLTMKLSSVTLAQGSLFPDTDMQPGTYVKLSVKDTGTGMTEAVRQRAFDPFFTTKGQGEGTGMGLAVVHGIVKSHGGAVTVKSKVGQGSTFELFLPQVERRDVRKEAAVAPPPTGTERVLLVDDEESLVAMGRSMLEGLGYRVTTATNGTSAWNLFLEDPSRFDVVITDQTMPDVTGLGLARLMLKKRRDLPVILCTGYSQTASFEKAKEAGVRAFMMKPFVRREVAETIRRVLDRNHTERAGQEG